MEVVAQLYNYLFAKKHGGIFCFALRIPIKHDLCPGKEQYILDALKWCKIEVDEGLGKMETWGLIASQNESLCIDSIPICSERGHAYYAFDTPEELEQMRERMKNAGVPSPQYSAVVRKYANSLTIKR